MGIDTIQPGSLRKETAHSIRTKERDRIPDSAESLVTADDSVKKSLAPEIETISVAEALGQSLRNTLNQNQSKALDAIGSFDEARIAELLKE